MLYIYVFYCTASSASFIEESNFSSIVLLSITNFNVSVTGWIQNMQGILIYSVYGNEPVDALKYLHILYPACPVSQSVSYFPN